MVFSGVLLKWKPAKAGVGLCRSGTETAGAVTYENSVVSSWVGPRGGGD